MVSFLAAAIVAGTPLLFATLGELITEKSGSLNLGVEGMMLMGAVMGFTAGYATGNPYIALLAAVLAGGAGALIFAIITVSLRANQVVTGLTLTIFGAGFARFVGEKKIGFAVPDTIKHFFVERKIPLLGDIPVVGEIFFKHDLFVYLGYVCVIAASIYFNKTRIGLNCKAVGESAGSADASGIDVTLYRYVNIVAGGALCGLGGAYLALVTVPIWQADVVTGRGWIAVALVIFASWKPSKSLIGAYLFGALNILGLRLQSIGIHVSQYLVDMIPYAATIIIVIISTHKNKKEDKGPADLSKPYFREER